jgi:hypothetical protein
LGQNHWWRPSLIQLNPKCKAGKESAHLPLPQLRRPFYIKKYWSERADPLARCPPKYAPPTVSKCPPSLCLKVRVSECPCVYMSDYQIDWRPQGFVETIQKWVRVTERQQDGVQVYNYKIGNLCSVISM